MWKNEKKDRKSSVVLRQWSVLIRHICLTLDTYEVFRQNKLFLACEWFFCGSFFAGTFGPMPIFNPTDLLSIDSGNNTEREGLDKRQTHSWRADSSGKPCNSSSVMVSIPSGTLNSSSDWAREDEACEVRGVTRQMSTASLTHVPMSSKWQLMLFNSCFTLLSLSWNVELYE